MMINSLLKQSTCMISCGKEVGTGFFIAGNNILTAKHVLKEFLLDNSTIIKVNNFDEDDQELLASYVDHCELGDVALINIGCDFNHGYQLELCNSDVIEEEKIKTYGYPKSFDGQLVGEPLSGSILRYIPDNTNTIHDISLNVDNFQATRSYAGFSGAPVVNHFGHVISMLRYENSSYISAVSTKKMLTFLTKHKISIKKEPLRTFEYYNKDVFIGFEDRKCECEIKSEKPLKAIYPKEILDRRKNEIFFPEKNKTLDEMISFLRTNKDLDSKLWSGWIQLLTYVEMLRGDYGDANNITIEMTSTELFKKLGILPVKKKVDFSLHLDFFFTEEENFFQVARKIVQKNIGSLDNKRHVCNVFNSNVANFGIKNVNANKIINDISCPENSVPSIPKTKLGVLSLQQLNAEVIKSETLVEACNNLKKRIEYAIN